MSSGLFQLLKLKYKYVFIVFFPIDTLVFNSEVLLNLNDLNNYYEGLLTGTGFIL